MGLYRMISNVPNGAPLYRFLSWNAYSSITLYTKHRDLYDAMLEFLNKEL